MKISCTKENLQGGLAIVSRVASKNLTLPILGNVLLRTEQGVLLLSATNLEVGAVARVRCKVEAEGSITVQARLLSEYISLSDHEKIELETNGQILRVSGGTSETTIRGMAADDFPIIPQVERERGLSAEAGELKEALTQVLFAAAQDTSRPEISGVFTHASGKTLTLAATDSYRLAERTMAVESKNLDVTTIIPSRALQELVRILPSSGTVEVFFGESQVLFSSEGNELTTRLIEGQYPDYKQIIPQAASTTATIEIDAFAKLVRTASLFCKPGINDVTVEFWPDKKIITCAAANTELGEHHGNAPATIDGSKNSIVFNFRYLLEGLANMTSGSVTVAVTDSASPGVLRPDGETNYLYLIMPIRQ